MNMIAMISLNALSTRRDQLRFSPAVCVILKPERSVSVTFGAGN